MSTVATILAEKQVKFEQGVNALAFYSREGISWTNMQKLIEDLRENCVTKENFDVYEVLERKCTDISKLIWGVAEPFPCKIMEDVNAMHACRNYLKDRPMVWDNLEANRVDLIKLTKIKFPDYKEIEKVIV